MRRIRGGLLALVAAGAGVGLAVAVGSAGAAPSTTTTTLGSTTGTPSMNICVAGLNCTYATFNGVASPALEVPFDGTVTSFSVNSGSGTGAVELRVLRPTGDGRFKGVATSAAEILALGPQTFKVSVPVKAGDVLGLDNSTSALLFDSTSPTPITAYYQPPPGLPDGTTGFPNNYKVGLRLLLSATVTGSTQNATTTNGTTITTTRSGGTVTVTKTIRPKPVIGNPTQSSAIWTRSKGTTFALGLSAAAKVTMKFRPNVGRRIAVGTITFNAQAGTVRRTFKGRLGGKLLKPGRYIVAITAANDSGTSKPVFLRFRITG
jgi:hypothetical protein